MSEENVEIVREVMDLMNLSRASSAEDDPRLIELFAANLHIDMSRRVFNPDLYEGRAGLQRLIREVREVWDWFWVTPERFIDAGERVVVIETRRGRGRESGLEVEDRSAVIWTVREGQVVRMETDLDPNEALEAMGLEE
jgi:ketosteroid isomerase-like protein